MLHLTNKVVVITGAANGLGKALAKEFFARGCNLALLDIDKTGLEKLKTELNNKQQTVTIHTTDIAKEEQIIAARQEILQVHKSIDTLINNAGVSISQVFDKVSINDFKWLFDINFWGTVYCTRHFLPDLHTQDKTYLVNIISGFALMGFPGKTTYASSKAAIMGFTNSLQTELIDTNIKLSLVVPPPLSTGIVQSGKHMNEEKRSNEIKFLQKNGISVEKAAQKIVPLVIKGKSRIVIGTGMFWTDIAARLFPTLLQRWIGRNKKRFDFV